MKSKAPANEGISPVFSFRKKGRLFKCRRKIISLAIAALPVLNQHTGLDQLIRFNQRGKLNNSFLLSK
jgi:hypothetical protein